jgi:hypothetical protein
MLALPQSNEERRCRGDCGTAALGPGADIRSLFDQWRFTGGHPSFAGRHADDEVAPIPAVRADVIATPGSLRTPLLGCVVN